MRNQLLHNQEEAWKLLFSFANLTDEDIKIIVDYEYSEEADLARTAILKMYTLETDLYGAINEANCTRD